jgi:hypothetical protein
MLSLVMMITQISHSFDFPFVSYELGVRHIHTPEHVAASHRLSLPGFHLVQTHPPARFDDGHIIAFRFKTLFGEQDARMFTSARNASSVMVFDTEGRAAFLAQLRVQPLGRHGHRLSISTDVFTPSFFSRLALPHLFNAHSIEDALAWGYNIRGEDPNLRVYRRRVLYRLKP